MNYLAIKSSRGHHAAFYYAHLVGDCSSINIGNVVGAAQSGRMIAAYLLTTYCNRHPMPEMKAMKFVMSNGFSPASIKPDSSDAAVSLMWCLKELGLSYHCAKVHSWLGGSFYIHTFELPKQASLLKSTVDLGFLEDSSLTTTMRAVKHDGSTEPLHEDRHLALQHKAFINNQTVIKPEDNDEDWI